MTEPLIDRIVRDVDAVPYQVEDSFTYAYFTFLQYFHDLSRIETQHVVIGAHFVYGWMPTILKLRHVNLEQAVEILNNVKQQRDITDNDILQLINLINNSLVGVSKLLHFINPTQYAIWDSRVVSYFDPHISYYHMHQPITYRRYVQACFEVSNHDNFSAVHQAINKKIGRPVSALRAIELVMYTGGARPNSIIT